LNITQSAWSCVATNTPEVTLTISNSNQLQNFQIASGSPFLDPANGGSIFSNSCGTTVSAGGQCIVTIRGTTNGSTTTFKINPASGSSFNAGSLTTTAAPICP
jgi:Na+-transporting NADH:ubiquinone oxidoreductase subunit NqrF